MQPLTAPTFTFPPGSSLEPPSPRHDRSVTSVCCDTCRLAAPGGTTPSPRTAGCLVTLNNSRHFSYENQPVQRPHPQPSPPAGSYTPGHDCPALSPPGRAPDPESAEMVQISQPEPACFALSVPSCGHHSAGSSPHAHPSSCPALVLPMGPMAWRGPDSWQL